MRPETNPRGKLLREQAAQDVLEDPAVAQVVALARGIESHAGPELQECFWRSSAETDVEEDVAERRGRPPGAERMDEDAHLLVAGTR